MALSEASLGRKEVRQEETEWQRYESELYWRRVLALLNELVLSICILILSILVLGVRKALILVRSLD